MSRKLHITEGGKEKPKKKKRFKAIVKSFLGMKSKQDDKKDINVEFEDKNRVVDASVNGWISSEYATHEEVEEKEEFVNNGKKDSPTTTARIVDKEKEEEIEEEVEDDQEVNKKKEEEEEENQNNIQKKRKINRNLTFSKELTQVVVFERENSQSSTLSDVSEVEKSEEVANSSVQNALVSDDQQEVENDTNEDDNSSPKENKQSQYEELMLKYEAYSYRELQIRAKELGIPANIKRLNMIEEILDVETSLNNGSEVHITSDNESTEDGIDKQKKDSGDSNPASNSDEDEEEDDGVRNTWHHTGGSAEEDEEENEDEKEESAMETASLSENQDSNDNTDRITNEMDNSSSEMDVWHTHDSEDENEQHDLDELLGINEDEDGGEEEGGDLTDAIQGFFMKHHCQEEEEENDHEESKSKQSTVETAQDEHCEGDIDVDEELDHFDELHLEGSSSILESMAGLSSIVLKGSKDDDESIDSRPRIMAANHMAANHSSKISVDNSSFMGHSDIILDDNVLEDDSDIISHNRRRRMKKLSDEGSTTVVSEDEFHHHHRDGAPTFMDRDIYLNGANESKLPEHVDFSVPLVPTIPRSVNPFHFADGANTISIDNMKSHLRILESRLLKICPAGLHTLLPPAAGSPAHNVTVRRQSLDTISSEGDFFDGTQPLPKREMMRRVDSNKTFDTVSSLGSSDVVDQKHKQLLKKHADEKKLQKKLQDQHLERQRRSRQEQRAQLKEASSYTIDQALASRRGYPKSSNGTVEPVHQRNSHQRGDAVKGVLGGATFHRAGSYGQKAVVQSSVRDPFSDTNKIIKSQSYQHHNSGGQRGQVMTSSSSFNENSQNELRPATSDILIDTFKSRSQKGHTAAVKNPYPVVKSSGYGKALNHQSSGSSGDNLSNVDVHNATSSRKLPHGTVDIYKPLPPEYILDPNKPPKSKKSRGGSSSTSSNVSDGDTTYQPSILTSTSGDDDTLVSRTSSAQSFAKLTSRTTAASRMRAAAIRDRGALHSSSSSSPFDHVHKNPLASPRSTSQVNVSSSGISRASGGSVRSQSYRAGSLEQYQTLTPQALAKLSAQTANTHQEIEPEQQSKPTLKSNPVTNEGYHTPSKHSNPSGVSKTSAVANQTPTSGGSTALARRARAIVSSRQSKNRNPSASTGHSHIVHDDTPTDRNDSLSPVRQAENPFLALI